MTHITVGRWGKSLAVRFPGDIARASGLTEGERVEIETRGGEIVLRRVVPHFTLEELFRGRSPEEWREAYAGAYDWGPDVGRERRGMTAPAYIPNAGDLIWTDLDPTLGREQVGRRPALVVSPAAFTENTGFAIVCPITSRVRPFPTSVVLPAGLPVAGEILTSHIRSVDTQARPVRYAGASVAPETALLVRAKLDTVITI